MIIYMINDLLFRYDLSQTAKIKKKPLIQKGFS